MGWINEMRMRAKRARELWELVPLTTQHKASFLREVLTGLNGVYERECPLCGYEGLFVAHGIPPRPDARCPQCKSVERHRQFWLYLERVKPLPANARILHFAPEATLVRKFRELSSHYTTADLTDKSAQEALDLEQIDRPDACLDAVVCSHVLEHVDDRKALSELYRVLRPGRCAFILIPIVEGWPETYEDPSIVSPEDRLRHYGQSDHVRIYGADFRDRVAAAGFELEEIDCTPADVRRYGLIPGEKIFVLRKPE